MKPLGKLVTLLVAMACSLPAIAQSDETAKRFHVFPQLADGGGWQSFLLVTNVAQSSSFCTFELHGLTVDRFSEVSSITASGSTATFSLEGDGGYVAWPTKNESALATGYATLDCTASVVGQVLYASVGQSGGITGLATVFSSQAGRAFQFTVLTADASLGIAIANDTNTRTSCDVVLEDTDRMHLGDATISILSKSNVARFLSQIIQIPPGFDGGSATISCDQQVAVIGLQFAGAVFTTLPPAILSASSSGPTDGAPQGSFGAGTWIVNEDISPGRYFTNPVSGCYWERLSGTTGTSSDRLANEFIGFDSGQEIVDIASSDYAFTPDHECGTWSRTPVTAPSSGTIPPGRWLVGSQIPAGQYQVNASSGCYWERLRGFSGRISDTIANDFVAGGGRQIITILSSDEGFYTDDDCGTWTRRTGFSSTAETVISPATDPYTIELNRQMYRMKNGLPR